MVENLDNKFKSILKIEDKTKRCGEIIEFIEYSEYSVKELSEIIEKNLDDIDYESCFYIQNCMSHHNFSVDLYDKVVDKARKGIIQEKSNISKQLENSFEIGRNKILSKGKSNPFPQFNFIFPKRKES